MDCAGFNCLRELEHGDHLEVTAIEGPQISFTIANESSPFRRQKLAAHIHDVVVGISCDKGGLIVRLPQTCDVSPQSSNLESAKTKILMKP
jgi:hypothetical protein